MIKHVSSLTHERILETIQVYSNDTNQLIIISGYITLAGFKSIEREINPNKIKRIIIGVFTEKAKDAFQYIEEEYPEIELFIYKFLGHADHQAKSYFTPILHAKIIAGYKSKKLKWAYTGSANITDFALNDENIESGIFIKEKNKELEKVNDTIKKINNKISLIDYKSNKGIFFTPDEKYVHDIEGTPTFKIPNTYLIIINDALGEREHQFIGIYCNQKEELLRLRNDDKLLFFFRTDRKLILNRVLNVGEKVYFPQDYISFYIENINNTRFKTKDIYDDSGNPDVFIIVENIKADENTERIMKKIGILINQKSDNLLKHHIDIKDDSFLDKIIFKETKSTLKSESLKYLENNKIVDITKLEIEKGDIITLKDLLADEDANLFNKHFPLNKIKKD
jgi:hypothetical protein